MSLQDKRAALFNREKGANGSSKPSSSTTSRSMTNGGKSGSSNPTPSATMSSATQRLKNMNIMTDDKKAEKLAEAEANMKKAAEYLKTSLFQWEPDHVGAAPKFESASKAYEVAGEWEKALDALKKCAKSHLAYNSPLSAANALQNAAKLCLDKKEFKMGADNFLEAADIYGQRGEATRMAEMYDKAAKALEGHDPDQAADFYKRACDAFCDEDNLEGSNSRAVGVVRSRLRFLLGDVTQLDRRMDDIMDVARLLARLGAALKYETDIWKAYATISIMQMYRRDFVAADSEFIQKHLSARGYGMSKEAEIVENLLSAFKNNDFDELDKIKNGPNMFFLDVELSAVVRLLDVPRVAKKALPPVITSDASMTIATGHVEENYSLEEESGVLKEASSVDINFNLTDETSKQQSPKAAITEIKVETNTLKEVQINSDFAVDADEDDIDLS